MAAAILIVSPFTEAFSALDNYPRGGQDFELSSFLLVALLCLVILVVLLGFHFAKQLLHKPSWESHTFWIALPHLISSFLCDATAWVPPKQLLYLSVFASPLRI